MKPFFVCTNMCGSRIGDVPTGSFCSFAERGGVTRNPLTMRKLEITVGFTNKHGTLSTVKNTLDI